MQPDGVSTPPPTRTSGLAAISLLAAGVAIYLSALALRQKGLPLGCGPEGGCAEVLSSRWSSLGPIPVGLLALPIYLACFAAAYWPNLRRAVPLRFFASLLVSGAVWFVGLQVFVLRAICPWCLAEHAIGLVIAALAWRLTATQPGRYNASVAAAAAAVGILAVAQWLLPASSTTARLAADPSDTPRVRQGSATQEDVSVSAFKAVGTVTLLQSHLVCDPTREPRIGDLAASRTLFLMFDYCCPHCRRTHEYLQTMLTEPSEPFAICCLPVPRASACNPEITETEPRFEHACELASLALAVWQVDSTKFAAFDRWLFESSAPRDPNEAYAEAERRVGKAALAAALAGDEIAVTIRRNVDAFNASDAEYLPVLLAPGMAPIIGRPESHEALAEMLDRDFFRGKGK